MALSAGVLQAAIRANLLASPGTGAIAGANLDAFCLAIASAVVSHVTSAATVSGTAVGAQSGGPGVPIIGTVS